ncbi:AMP-binding protein [Pseudomonas sp. FEN]|uniref:AMP-binding protein n=1 Tax=Pseudomonas sp. FEN TaxID=2767468 RepID=UPI00398F945B
MRRGLCTAGYCQSSLSTDADDSTTGESQTHLRHRADRRDPQGSTARGRRDRILAPATAQAPMAEAFVSPARENDLCYTVFTSGTTGIPKAVAITHRSWANLINWHVNEYGPTRKPTAFWYRHSASTFPSAAW